MHLKISTKLTFCENSLQGCQNSFLQLNFGAVRPSFRPANFEFCGATFATRVKPELRTCAQKCVHEIVAPSAAASAYAVSLHLDLRAPPVAGGTSSGLLLFPMFQRPFFDHASDFCIGVSSTEGNNHLPALFRYVLKGRFPSYFFFSFPPLPSQ